MKIPYGWVRELVAVELSAAEAADRLINAGLEVAGVTPIAPGLRGVVVGEIEAVERELGESQGHRLALCRVTTGAGRYAVVCGAPNARPGLRAAFAPPGATLPGGPVMVARIRGVESEGMLCSERELGLGDEHEAGVLALDPDAPLGADLLRHLALDDAVLEIEITPNRPDCLSVLGVARELAALTGARLTPPAIALKEADEPAEALARVRVEAVDLCPRYTVRVVTGVTVGPSPAWMAARLRACGLRPISNVVDVTNYVMWEHGQPLHAFDAATVADRTIVVRRAGAGERLTTLDGQVRTLDPSMLLIADRTRPIGLAGVMGGASSEVTAGTTGVLLESAYFQAASVRRTSRALGLRTDAAYRFERGADIEGLADASARAAQLIAELAGGVVARGLLDAYPAPRPPRRLPLRMARVRRVVGIAPPRDEARRILGGLGLPTRERGEDLEVEIPSFRRDLTLEDDLVEEIIRVWGYDRIPSVTSPSSVRLVTLPASVRQADAVRRALVGAGLVEVVTYSFTDPAHALALRSADDKEPIELVNPLSQEAALLSPHPLAGLLGAVATNLRRQQSAVRLFEIGKTYLRADEGPREPRWAAIALTGLRAEPAWYRPPEAADVYDAKGLAEHVLDALGVEGVPAPGRLAGFEPDAHGALALPDGVVLAEFGEVAADVRARFDIDAPVFAAVVALDAVAAAPARPARYEPLPRYPAVQRDLAFVLDDADLTAAQVQAAVRVAAGPLLRDLTVFDVFRLPDGRRSVAWRLTFQADDRTLTDDEVNATHARIVARVTADLRVTLRGA